MNTKNRYYQEFRVKINRGQMTRQQAIEKLELRKTRTIESVEKYPRDSRENYEERCNLRVNEYSRAITLLKTY